MISRIPDCDISGKNTFRMRVRCAVFLEVSEEGDLEGLDFEALPQPVIPIGGGSNLLFTGDFPGTLLHFSGKCSAPGAGQLVREDDGTVLVTLPAGTVFDDFCAWASDEGLWGPENLSLIPGEAGASAVQNIGAYGVEAKDIIESVRAWDRKESKFVEIKGADCGYGYRESNFKSVWKGRYIITAVTFRLTRNYSPRLEYGALRNALTQPLTPAGIRQAIIDIRNAKLPPVEQLGSAGSFFKNPVVSPAVYEKVLSIARSEKGPDAAVPHFDLPEGVKIPAAWLIDTCGLKGAEIGGAAVYRNQPLVIVNASGNAAPGEILALERHIIDTVRAKYGITLHPEVEHI